MLLGEAGYVVDVADVADKAVSSPHEYDLIISHGAGLQSLALRLKRGGKKVYLATGMRHSERNAEVKRRLDLLNARRGCRLSDVERCDEGAQFVSGADAIVGFGNDCTMSSWRDAFDVPVYRFNNYGFPSTPFVSGRDASASGHFLFFGGFRQVLKGLDILLDVFSRHPDLHLYVCGSYHVEPDFCRCYKRELFGMSNIHPMGHVRVMSEAYGKLMRQCGFVILPSCSEGQAGSVVQCMHSGLVPVVTRSCGIDVDGFGFLLEDDSIEAVERIVLDLSRLPAERLLEMSRRTRRVAETEYSEEAFLKRWREILGLLHK